MEKTYSYMFMKTEVGETWMKCLFPSEIFVLNFITSVNNLHFHATYNIVLYLFLIIARVPWISRIWNTLLLIKLILILIIYQR
jgi:hypothetical protein